MQGLCDSCEERVDHLIDLTRLQEFRTVVRRMNYRKVCSICYDDLYEEIRQEQAATDERRSETRYWMRLSIVIEGTDKEGKRFSEKVYTEDVSNTGARIHTSRQLEKGAVLTMKVPELNFETPVLVELVWQDINGKAAGLKLTEESSEWKQMVQEQALDSKRLV